ncbi:hypothetical protein [Haloarcula marina]|uniref:hypothetical protein n=1 Tax=Haloarcula marina TaxID=2961574 RepID=UPI0020B66DC2|nr:hypothetical protein [Halomicroarcula marina]
MIALQLSQIPTPDAQSLALAVLCLVAGMAVPTRYGMERIEGFGRWVASKLPYKAPPGKESEQAMADAVYGPRVEDADAVDSEEQQP